MQHSPNVFRALALPATLLLLVLPSPVAGDFVRGDSNQDGRVNVTDAITVVVALFGQGALTCADAADSNDDGNLDLRDTLATLRALFQGERLPFPTTTSGPDLTCDALSCDDARVSTPGVLLSELHYHPDDIVNESPEFLELYNRTSVPIALDRYRLASGVRFDFSSETVLGPGAYLIVAKDPNSRFFRSIGTTLGPYEGELSNSGETITLWNGDCIAEAITYDDRPPWPLAPDGYRTSLERVDYQTPADDHHSWRSSLQRGVLGGTGGAENSTLGTPTHPLATHFETRPEYPTSTDTVTVVVAVDLPRAAIASVVLRSSQLADMVSEASAWEAQLRDEDSTTSRWQATLPPAPSQSLVRLNMEVTLATGERLTLPHPGDVAPFFSYFVYDGEIDTKLPLMWIFPARPSQIVPEAPRIGGAVVLEQGAEHVQLFDGADVSRRSTNNTPDNGINLSFLRGQEYRGNRTLNLPPERGGQTPDQPQIEHTAFEIFRSLGALAPASFWFRVIDYSRPSRIGERHGQRIALQQVNRRFLAGEGIDPDGDLYKLDRGGFIKRTNLATGQTSRIDFQRALNEGRIREVLDLESAVLYSAIGMLLSNDEGFGGNNMFVYYDQHDSGLWKYIPWDLDVVFRCPRLAVTFPLDGVSGGSCRTRPPRLTQFYHQAPDLDASYRDLLLSYVVPGGPYTVEVLFPQLAAVEELLLDDLALHEAALGVERTARRTAIASSYERIREHVRARGEFLREVLGAGR